jgi:hypothetical protein
MSIVLNGTTGITSTGITETADGNVGIGISSPAAPLDVFKASQGGTATFRAYGPAGQILWANGGTSTSYLDSDTIVFRKSSDGGNTERLRILSTGGITFNGDTAAANALDDYEEGTFTPTVIGGSTAGTGTYNLQSGSYTKVGRLVSFRLQVFWSSHTGTGGLFVSSLPFSCSGIGGVTIGLLNDIPLTASNYAMSDLVDGGTSARFRNYPVGGSGITDVSISNGGNIVLSGTYFTS